MWAPLLLALAASFAYAVHIPSLGPAISSDFDSQVYFAGSAWDLDAGRKENTTSRFIFDTVSSFLQHWPNTRYRNGHAVVPGIVPLGTLLYHGRPDSNLPTVPEWTATDPEHSYLFCRGTKETGCWHLTLATSRPLQVLYFDGSSAAKMFGGPIDSQDILAWREVRPDEYFSERERLAKLCEWGKEFNLDGFVRMEMDFEIMLCDFTPKGGVEVVSFLNLASSDRGPIRRPPPPPPKRGHRFHSSFALHEPYMASTDTLVVSDVIYSGSLHNIYPGDTRIQLDYSRVLSFYDTSLVPSLVSVRYGKNRLQHRLLGISEEDIATFMSTLEKLLKDPPVSSGVDWSTLFRVIIDHYGDRLDFLQDLLDATEATSSKKLLQCATIVQKQLASMLRSYIVFSAVPPSTPSGNFNWSSPIYELCATTHTKFVASARLTSSERLLLQAIRETTGEICRVLTRMWAQGVELGLDDIVSPNGDKTPSECAGKIVLEWKRSLGSLINWLDWPAVFLKCRPACGPEELCYLPTWPFFRRRGEQPGGPSRRPGWPSTPERLRESTPEMDPEDPYDWEDPKPTCVRRIEIMSFDVLR